MWLTSPRAILGRVQLLVVVTVGVIPRALPVETMTEIASWDYWRTMLAMKG